MEVNEIGARIVLFIMLLCNTQFICWPSERGKNLDACLQEEAQGERGNISYLSKGNTSFLLKNGSVPRDMLVLSIMTLSADLLRQIATDPHGFSRAHSIGNGLFNFPQGALPFPRYASLKQHPLLGLGSHTKIFTSLDYFICKLFRSRQLFYRF